jgi:CopG family transcriptional regulator, nickel-responsive regulator
MSKTSRISMSIPKDLIDEFDEVLKNRNYHSRSKGIRDALKDYIVRYRWMNEMEGERVGTLAVIYNHHYTGVMEDLTTIQHDYQMYINAVMHVHLTKNHCLEVIVVKGDMNYIRDLTEKIMRLKGVEQVRLTSTSSGQEMENPKEILK